MNAPAAKTRGDRVLDFAGAAEVLNDLGVTKRNGSPVDRVSVREWADAGKLPFFKSPSGVRVILHSVLIASIEGEQRKAVDATRKPRAPRRRRA